MSVRFTRVGVSAAFAVLVTTAAIGAPVGAAADDSQSVAVRTDDLDLASSAGVRSLQRRVTSAAHTVCGGYDIRDLRAVSAAQTCRKVALESAAPQVEIAIATARGGKTLAANTVRIGANAH